MGGGPPEKGGTAAGCSDALTVSNHAAIGVRRKGWGGWRRPPRGVPRARRSRAKQQLASAALGGGALRGVHLVELLLEVGVARLEGERRAQVPCGRREVSAVEVRAHQVEEAAPVRGLAHV